MLYIKKIKRKCGVRGCKNTSDVYALSKNREMGNSIIACKECLMEALNTIEEQNKHILGEKAVEVIVEDTTEPKIVAEEPKIEPTKTEETPKAENKPKTTRQRKK